MSQREQSIDNSANTLHHVMERDARMKTHKKAPAAIDAEGVTRISVSVATPDYEHLLRVAESKRVFIAWVVRDAVEKYLTADMPLFSKEERLSQ